MRFATAQYFHETNCFSNILIDREFAQKKRYTVSFFNYCRGVRSDNGAYIDACEKLGIELVPSAHYSFVPSGPSKKDAFEEALADILEQLWKAHCEKPLDGILLQLHGAGVAEGYFDLEGEVLRAVRERFGKDIFIGTSLDLHSNVTPEMVELCDVIVGYKGYPHTDSYETAYKMVELMYKLVNQKERYGKALVKLPWLLAPSFGLTMEGPAHDVQQKLYKMMEEDPDLYDLTFFHGFAYADIPQASVSIVATAKDDATAQKAANKLARYAWDHRKDFLQPIYSAKEAMDLAEKAEGIVVINEASDNPGGGCPGDGTHLLREMLERNLPGTAFGFIFDPEVAEQAAKAGVGATISCYLGAKNDNLHGEPIFLEKAYVKAISDGHFIRKNPMGKGAHTYLRTMAHLVVGNVHIAVGSVRTQTMDDGPFISVGIDWREMKILGLKSTLHFRGWWADQVDTIIPCNSPGIHTSDLTKFQFKNANTSYFPLGDPEWNE